MHSFRSSIHAGLLLSLSLVVSPAALCADIIVSAQDGKFVRVDGRATFPEPAPPDSLVVIDASTFPPVIKGTVEGLEHTVQGAEAAQGVVFSQDGKQILLQMDVERAIGVFAIRDGKLVDTGERLKLAAGPVSIRSMPR